MYKRYLEFRIGVSIFFILRFPFNDVFMKHDLTVTCIFILLRTFRIPLLILKLHQSKDPFMILSTKFL